DLLSTYELIKDEGFEITVISPVVYGTFDPVEETQPVITVEETYDTYGVQLSYNDFVIDGTRIEQKDIKMLIPAYEIPFEIESDFFVEVPKGSGERYRVIRPNPLKPANEPILYKAQLRQ
ncbi:unnamed protein product, partial [marine sediment metagenome]